jgi:hypothetical protein
MKVELDDAFAIGRVGELQAQRLGIGLRLLHAIDG